MESFNFSDLIFNFRLFHKVHKIKPSSKSTIEFEEISEFFSVTKIRYLIEVHYGTATS